MIIEIIKELRQRGNLLLKLIGLSGFAFILSKIELKELGDMISKMQPNYIIVAVPLFFIIIAAKTWRWHTILCLDEINLSFFVLLRAYLASFYVGAITPGRIGEFVKFMYVHARGFSISTSFFSALLDRLWDLGFLILMSYLGFLLLLSFLTSTFTVMIVAFLGIILALFLLLIFYYGMPAYLKNWGMQLLKKLIPDQYLNSSERTIICWNKTLRKYSPKTLLVSSLGTLISWIVYYLQLYLLARGLLIPLSFKHLVAFVSIAAVLSMIPITISGIGIRDATLIYLFKQVNLSSESAVAFSLSILFLFVINSIIGSFFWFTQPISNKEIVTNV